MLPSRKIRPTCWWEIYKRTAWRGLCQEVSDEVVQRGRCVQKYKVPLANVVYLYPHTIFEFVTRRVPHYQLRMNVGDVYPGALFEGAKI